MKKFLQMMVFTAVSADILKVLDPGSEFKLNIKPPTDEEDGFLIIEYEGILEKHALKKDEDGIKAVPYVEEQVKPKPEVGSDEWLDALLEKKKQ